MQEIDPRRKNVAGQLIPLPELAPPVPKNLSSEQWISLWADLYDAGEKLLLAGLRLKIGPDGDIKRHIRIGSRPTMMTTIKFCSVWQKD